MVYSLIGLGSRFLIVFQAGRVSSRGTSSLDVRAVQFPDKSKQATQMGMGIRPIYDLSERMDSH